MLPDVQNPGWGITDILGCYKSLPPPIDVHYVSSIKETSSNKKAYAEIYIAGYLEIKW